MNVLSAFFGLCTGIPLVYFFRQKGVVPSLISVAAMTILTSWWYSRKLVKQVPNVMFRDLRLEASALLKLGSAFMASGLMVIGVAYFTRITLLRKLGIEATGLYQSAWTLGGLYVGFILQAMGADFYPRLAASATDNNKCNRLVNEQALIGLLLAGPGVIATLTFAPVVIALFYSTKFGAAVEVLRWICLGVTLQVITWPMGFIIIAKSKSSLFFFAELAWSIVAVGLTWLCVTSSGLRGAGIAYFGSYVFHWLLIYPIVNQLSRFRLSSDNLRIILVSCSSIGLVFCTVSLFPLTVALTLGTIMFILSTVYSIRTIVRVVPPEYMPRQIRYLLTVCKIA
jgi:PST family polysaccharide transporter